MNGLILSKDADQYLALAQSQQPEFQAYAYSQPTAVLQLSETEREHITWMLVEPSLAVEVLNELPNLQWLQSTWAGVEPLIQFPRRDYTLTNIRGVFAPLMSEYVLTHCLAHERRLSAHIEAQKQHRWLNHQNGAHVGTLRGKTLLVLGVGSIGQGIAQTVHHLGMRVLGIASKARTIADIEEVGTFADLARFLPQADYVVNTLPNTPQTVDLIDQRFLTQMKPTAVLINVGRGQAVIETDLAHALDGGMIAAAVLDVYRTEPLPPEHIFWNTPNLTLTSHTAAPSFPNDIFTVFWDNYQRFQNQQPLQYTVDFAKGY